MKGRCVFGSWFGCSGEDAVSFIFCVCMILSFQLTPAQSFLCRSLTRSVFCRFSIVISFTGHLSVTNGIWDICISRLTSCATISPIVFISPETGTSLGKICPVFYPREFLNTVPPYLRKCYYHPCMAVRVVRSLRVIGVALPN